MDATTDLAVIPLVTGLVLALKQIPPLRPEGRRWILPFLSIAIAIGVTWIQAGAISGPLALQGLVFGLAASGLYSAGNKTVRKVAERAKGPALLLVCVALLPLAAGCAAHDFMTRAPAALAEGANELETGIEEYHAAAVAEMDSDAADQRQALKQDLAEYVVEIVNAGVEPGTVTIDHAKERLAANFDTFDRQQASLAAERAVERERYLTMKSLVEWMRRVAGQIVEIETRRYATLEELRELAARAARDELTEPRRREE